MISFLVRALLTLGGVGLLAAAWMLHAVPDKTEDRIEVTPELTGVHSGESYAWILKTPNGAVLVDAGGDLTADAVMEELRVQGRSAASVQAVLVTHGHWDHWSGAHLFPNARVWVGPGELSVLRGTTELKSLGARILGWVSTRPPLPRSVEELKDGQKLEVDGESFQVLHVPGHTPGSAMYLWRDVLFTGDSLLGKKHSVTAPPSFVSESAQENRASLARLKDVSFTRIADGHSGLWMNARQKLRAYLAGR